MERSVLFVSDREYDVGTLNKVIQANSVLGQIHIHDAEGGYLLSFSGCPEGAEKSVALFRQYLVDLTNNRWSH